VTVSGELEACDERSIVIGSPDEWDL